MKDLLFVNLQGSEDLTLESLRLKSLKFELEVFEGFEDIGLTGLWHTIMVEYNLIERKKLDMHGSEKKVSQERKIVRCD